LFWTSLAAYRNHIQMKHGARSDDRVDVDVLIIGGGFVGSTLAAALAETAIRVAMVDTQDPAAAISAEFDGRSFAVSLSNTRLLEGIDIWPQLAPCAAPILDIRISDGASLFFLHYDHTETGDDPMGFMVENYNLRRALHSRLSDSATTIFAPDKVEKLERGQGFVTAQLRSGQIIRARLAIGADGRFSQTRTEAGIGVTQWPYKQSGIVCTLRLERRHDFVAHERFLPAGPFAILPLHGDSLADANRASIVWTEPGDVAQAMMDLDETDFCEELQNRIGGFLGEIVTTGPRYIFPLGLQFAETMTAPRLALVGDAAHAMHPIAGQGLNMGLRDVAALAEVLVDARRLGQDLGSAVVLERFSRWRRFDNTVMLAATDGLNRLFSNDIAPVRLARDLGLATVNKLPPLKRVFMRHAMGVVGELPRLLRGESLL
jgi:2-octaprenyl-6-methoxyphenol hydroxylase